MSEQHYTRRTGYIHDLLYQKLKVSFSPSFSSGLAHTPDLGKRFNGFSSW